MAIDPDHAATFLDFVSERHRIYLKRQAGEPAPWTDDQVLASLKFTNMFRVLDPGSQFVLTDLDYPGLHRRDLLLRLFMYRFTNEPKTWRRIKRVLGRYPLEIDLYSGGVEDALKGYREAGFRVFSGAYMIVPQPGHKGDKIEHVMELTRTFMREHANDFLAAPTQVERFTSLRAPFGVGDFMAMQILTDWGYTQYAVGRPEDEFVICGPGSRKGAKLVDPDAKPEAIVEWAQKALASEQTVFLPNGMLPSLMDCQNMFCEYFKYDRERKRLRAGGNAKKPYQPAHPGAQPAAVMPPRW